MFRRLFPKARPANEAIAEAIYAQIVAAARQPRLYSEWEVPDTPLGRFEMICLHMILVQRRLLDQGPVAASMAQTLIDAYFTEVEHSLRELGIGDASVPKRLKVLGRMHFGRIAAYASALDAQDVDALAAALTRNVRPGIAVWPGARPLAIYVRDTAASIEAQDIDAIMSGRVTFPSA